MEKQDWLKIKRYNHIGEPLSLDNRHDIESYVRNENKIIQHAFFPLIKRDIKKYRLKKDETGKRKKRLKIRPICYATHLDSAIYSFYAAKIAKDYEAFLKKNHLTQNVTAYRKIKCDDKNNTGNKCNIDYAKEVFDYIYQNVKYKELAVITFDIKGFFDNLDHKLLKYAWKEIRNLKSLDEPSYAVYRNIIKYSYVKESDLFNLYKEQIICQTASGIKCKKVKRKRYLRDKKAIAFCQRKDISLIRTNNLIYKGNFDYHTTYKYTHKGIPQGLPISAVLANVYMKSFDQEIADYIGKISGLYRRYSDDIIIVCPIKDGILCKKHIIERIKELKLEIEENKTNFFTFKQNDKGVIECYHSSLGKNKKLEYLGFSYDGQKILVKDSSLGNYYHKMNKSAQRCIYYSIHNQNKKNNGKLFENKLVYRFSILGSRKHRIFIRSKHKPYYFYKSKRTSMGNYWTYIKKASTIMDSKDIIKQMRRNKSKLRNHIFEAKIEIARLAKNNP